MDRFVSEATCSFFFVKCSTNTYTYIYPISRGCPSLRVRACYFAQLTYTYAIFIRKKEEKRN